MLSFFKKRYSFKEIPLLVDIHSHLLPQIDDGSSSMEETLELLACFQNLGFKKVITTPHIQDLYPNTKKSIVSKLKEVKEILETTDLEIRIEAAAEYYFDESLPGLISDKENLLTFGDDYVLFETPFLNEPFNLKELIFEMFSSGLKPVLAHPERYSYLQSNFKLAQDLWERGLLFQLNVASLSGLYSPLVSRFAKKLIGNKMVSFLGSDCHNLIHFEHYKKSLDKKFFHKALDLPLLNQSLL